MNALLTNLGYRVRISQSGEPRCAGKAAWGHERAMAQGKKPQTFIKDDEIRVDTSSAPWMDYAKGELGKNIRELVTRDSFIESLRWQQTVESQLNATPSLGAG